MAKKNGVMEKLKKLLAMSDPKGGASTNEIDTALKMLDKLMKENNISMAEVTKAEDDLMILESDPTESKNVRVWHTYLASVMALLCDTQAICVRFTGSRKRNFRFMGVKKDVEISLAAFNSFMDIIETTAKFYYPTSRAQRSYAEGYVNALNIKITDMKQQDASESTAMIFWAEKRTRSPSALRKKNTRLKSMRRCAKIQTPWHTIMDPLMEKKPTSIMQGKQNPKRSEPVNDRLHALLDRGRIDSLFRDLPERPTIFYS